MAVYLGDKQVNIVGGQPIIVEGTDTTSNNPATSSDMIAGKEAFVNGEKVIGTYVPLDTSDANATAADIAEGVTAYVDGEKITGNVSVLNSNHTIAVQSINPTLEGEFINLIYDVNNDKLMRSGSKIELKSHVSNFGDASPEDVVADKTFTSTSGLKVTGTLDKISSVYADTPESMTYNSNIYRIEIPTKPFTSCKIVDTDTTVTVRPYAHLFGTAKPEDVVAGKTFTSTTGFKVTGTLEEKGSPAFVGTGPVVTMSPGSASGWFVGNEAIVESDVVLRAGTEVAVCIPYDQYGTATKDKVLSGETFTATDGVKATGTIPKKAAQTYTPTTTDQTIASGQYLNEAQTIKGDANLVAANIKKGATIFGVSGSFEGGPQVGAIVKAQAVSNVQIASGSSTTAKVKYGSAVTSSNGVVSISNPTELKVSSTSSLEAVKGKYVQQATSYGTTTYPVYFIPSTATFTQGGSTYNRTYTVSTANQMFVYGGQ